MQDAHGTWAEVDRMRRLYQNGQLKIRLYKTITQTGAGADRLIAQGPGPTEFNDHFQVRDIKIVMDGALGSRGAALLAPYSDEPGTTGLITTDTVAVKAMLVRALRAGVQVETHAIGDRANRIILDLYAAAMKAVPPAERKVKDPRWRVEHAQIVNPADLPALQGARPHRIDAGVARHRRPLLRPGAASASRGLNGAYAWQTFFKLGVPVAGGTDARIERGEPMIEFYAAVARKALDGRSGPANVWHPRNGWTREQALKMFTWFPAYAAFEEDRHGSIVTGKAADFTVLDQDIMRIPEAEIPKTKNVMTISGGGDRLYGEVGETRGEGTVLLLREFPLFQDQLGEAGDGAHAELVHERFAVRLDGAMRDPQPCGDFLVRLAVRDAEQDVALARRQSIEPRDRGRRVLRGREPGGDCRREVALAAMHGANRPAQFGQQGVLEQVAARAGADALQHVFRLVIHRQDDDPGRQVEPAQFRSDLDAGAPRHRDVHHQHVGAFALHERDRFVTVLPFRHHRDARFALEHATNSLAHHRVVVHHRYPNRAVSQASASLRCAAHCNRVVGSARNPRSVVLR